MQTIGQFDIMIEDALDALDLFQKTGDRSKFREWLEKYTESRPAENPSKQLGISSLRS